MQICEGTLTRASSGSESRDCKEARRTVPLFQSHLDTFLEVPNAVGSLVTPSAVPALQVGKVGKCF